MEVWKREQRKEILGIHEMRTNVPFLVIFPRCSCTGFPKMQLHRLQFGKGGGTQLFPFRQLFCWKLFPQDVGTCVFSPRKKQVCGGVGGCMIFSRQTAWWKKHLPWCYTGFPLQISASIWKQRKRKEKIDDYQWWGKNYMQPSLMWAPVS